MLSTQVHFLLPPRTGKRSALEKGLSHLLWNLHSALEVWLGYHLSDRQSLWKWPSTFYPVRSWALAPCHTTTALPKSLWRRCWFAFFSNISQESGLWCLETQVGQVTVQKSVLPALLPRGHFPFPLSCDTLGLCSWEIVGRRLWCGLFHWKAQQRPRRAIVISTPVLTALLSTVTYWLQGGLKAWGWKFFKNYLLQRLFLLLQVNLKFTLTLEFPCPSQHKHLPVSDELSFILLDLLFVIWLPLSIKGEHTEDRVICCLLSFFVVA